MGMSGWRTKPRKVRQFHLWQQNGLGGLAIVIMNQADQHLPTADGTFVRAGRPGLIVVSYILDQDTPQMARVEDEQVIETRVANRAYRAFSKGIGIGRVIRGSTLKS